MTYAEWQVAFPEAALQLRLLLKAEAHTAPETTTPGSEAYAQQQARLQIAKQGGVAWRNNVGAMKAKERHNCPRCGFHFEVTQAPVRWGLCNDSSKLNARIKSSDLIGIVPRLITQDMVGSTVGQFAAIETKSPGWKYSGNAHEEAQLKWLQLVVDNGGLAMFSTGDVKI